MKKRNICTTYAPIKETTKGKYNYNIALYNNILVYVCGMYEPKSKDFEQLYRILTSTLADEKSVTGGEDGMYFDEIVQVKKAVFENLDLLRKAFDKFELDEETRLDYMSKPRKADYLIRCSLLDSAVNEVLIALDENGFLNNYEDQEW